MNIQRWAYLGLGVLMLVLGIFFYFSANQFRATAEKATGTVVDFHRSGREYLPDRALHHQRWPKRGRGCRCLQRPDGRFSGAILRSRSARSHPSG
jgi:hypothetical protein